jgi:hypothetical protein
MSDYDFHLHSNDGAPLYGYGSNVDQDDYQDDFDFLEADACDNDSTYANIETVDQGQLTPYICLL